MTGPLPPGSDVPTDDELPGSVQDESERRFEEELEEGARDGDTA